MSWSFHISATSHEAAHQQIDNTLESSKPHHTGARTPVLEAAAKLLHATVDAAPPGSTFSLSVGGHFEENNVVTGAWFSTSIIPPLPPQ